MNKPCKWLPYFYTFYCYDVAKLQMHEIKAAQKLNKNPIFHASPSVLFALHSLQKKFTITLKYDYFSLFFLISFFQHNLYIFRCLNAFIMIASDLFPFSLVFYFSLSLSYKKFSKSPKRIPEKNSSLMMPLFCHWVLFYCPSNYTPPSEYIQSTKGIKLKISFLISFAWNFLKTKFFLHFFVIFLQNTRRIISAMLD